MKGQLQSAMKSAMKSKDKLRLESIRMLLSAIQYEELQKQVNELAKEECLAVLQREHKKRREELEFAEKAGRQDLKDKFTAEIAVIEEFLPQQLSPAQLEEIISGMKSQNPALNIGLVMKALKESYAGQYDSRQASEIAKRLLA